MLDITFLTENWSDILFFVLLMIVYMIVVTLNNGVELNANRLMPEKKTMKTIILETFF